MSKENKPPVVAPHTVLPLIPTPLTSLNEVYIFHPSFDWAKVRLIINNNNRFNDKKNFFSIFSKVLFLESV
jgi:hypothetical protein